MKNAHKKPYAEPYTDKWLKELTEAMAVPSFRFTPAKKSLPADKVKTPTTRYDHEGVQRNLTRKQQGILILAQSLPKNY